jgi:hypothetical protein
MVYYIQGNKINYTYKELEFMNNKLIYRVCTDSESKAKIENRTNIPGANNSFTGFWTTKEEDAQKLWKDRDNSCYELEGGGTEARIFQTTLDNVILESDFKKFKCNHDSRYDDNEIFVIEIKDTSKIIQIKEKGEKPIVSYKSSKGLTLKQILQDIKDQEEKNKKEMLK